MKNLLLIWCFLFPLSLWAYDVEIDGIYYNLHSKSKTATVTKGDRNYYGKYTIPEFIQDSGVTYTVTEIGLSAFESCRDVTAVTLPPSIKEISERGFAYTGITTITLPDGLEKVGNSAFGGCKSLSSITFPNTVTQIGDHCLAHCEFLSMANLPSSIVEIPLGLFSECKKLETIIIPNSVKTIGGYAFSHCTSLEKITFPESIEKIDFKAFEYCTSLREIDIPSTISKIGDGSYGLTFSFCSELTKFTCRAEKVPQANENMFESSGVEYATLYVPANAIEQYKKTAPWSYFGTILPIGGNSNEQCSTPEIKYEDGVLTFHSDTEGAEVYSTIKALDAGDYISKKVNLSVTYEITAYAKKSGYLNSEPAKATLCWIDAKPEQTGTVDLNQLKAAPIIVKSISDVIEIDGIADGDTIDFYTFGGQFLGNAQPLNGQARFETSENMIILKIKDKAIKIMK